MPSDAEIFIQHLQEVFGDEDAIHKVDADDGGPPVAVFVYNDTPEPGMITGVFDMYDIRRKQIRSKRMQQIVGMDAATS